MITTATVIGVASVMNTHCHQSHFCKICFLMQIAHPSFLKRTLPAIEGKQVRLVHTPPAFENVSLHGDVFSQVSTPLLHSIDCQILSQFYYLSNAACPLSTDSSLAVNLHSRASCHCLCFLPLLSPFAACPLPFTIHTPRLKARLL